MSSSPRVTRLSSPVFEVGISPSPLGTADAALASDNDNPAAPNTGRALLRRFCFEVCFAWGIVNSFHTPSDVLDGRAASSERRQYLYQSDKRPRGELYPNPSPQNFRVFWQHRSFLTKPVISDINAGLRGGRGQISTVLGSRGPNRAI